MTGTRSDDHAQDTIRTWADRLVGLSHSLHTEPETAFQEHRSAHKITAPLEEAGFDVTRGVGDLPTALVATRGRGDLVIGLCAEYDALPEIGHGCGHNVNGAASVGAALALGALTEELGITVKLVGTPAEEEGGGKVLLRDAGVFDDVATAMMVHAAAEDVVGASSFAASTWDITYTGRPAHAAAAPWDGINALDAMTLAQTAVGLLRQQLPPGTLTHGIVTDGGHATNVIPAHTSARWETRARTLEQLHDLQQHVRRAFEAGAVGTGAELTIQPHGRDYAELHQDAFMTESYRCAAHALGRTVHSRPGEPIASTDIGNLSHELPTIQPTIGYDTGGAPHHTAEFAHRSTGPSADQAVLDGASALSGVAIDLASTDSQRQRLLTDVAQRKRAVSTSEEREA